MTTIDIPIKLLHECQGYIVTVELLNGHIYRGKPVDVEDNSNTQLDDVTGTGRDGRVGRLEHIFVRGSHVRFFVVPEMLRKAPMFMNASVKMGQPGMSVATSGGRRRL
jgi:small nuclear ribonucleoprotein D3